MRVDHNHNGAKVHLGALALGRQMCRGYFIFVYRISPIVNRLRLKCCPENREG
jgi:hypothetical protein